VEGTAFALVGAEFTSRRIDPLFR